MRIALKIAYDGRSFHGYARQPHLQTIENSLINTFIDHEIFSNPKTAYFLSSSRTDKGVSSFGNVIAFNTEKTFKDYIEKCNTSLENIIIYGFKQIESTFYPRYAKQRIYRYYLKKNNNNIESIRSTAELFKGTFNFSNFARIEPKKTPIRTIEKIRIHETTDFILIDFYAQTFLWQQIRRILSAIIQVEKNKITHEDIHEALRKPEKPVDYGLISAQYLILMDVIYDFTFKFDQQALKKKEKMKHSIIHDFKYPSLKNANRPKQKTLRSIEVK